MEIVTRGSHPVRVVWDLREFPNFQKPTEGYAACPPNSATLRSILPVGALVLLLGKDCTYRYQDTLSVDATPPALSSPPRPLLLSPHFRDSPPSLAIPSPPAYGSVYYDWLARFRLLAMRLPWYSSDKKESSSRKTTPIRPQRVCVISCMSRLQSLNP